MKCLSYRILGRVFLLSQKCRTWLCLRPRGQSGNICPSAAPRCVHLRGSLREDKETTPELLDLLFSFVHLCQHDTNNTSNRGDTTSNLQQWPQKVQLKLSTQSVSSCDPASSLSFCGFSPLFCSLHWATVPVIYGPEGQWSNLISAPLQPACKSCPGRDPEPQTVNVCERLKNYCGQTLCGWLCSQCKNGNELGECELCHLTRRSPFHWFVSGSDERHLYVEFACFLCVYMTTPVQKHACSGDWRL